MADGSAAGTAPSGVKEILAAQARRGRQGSLITLPEVTVTAAELDALSDRAAALLAAHAVGPGSVVATLSPNSLTQLVTWFAAAACGAVFMPVNALLRGEALRTVLAAAPIAVAVVHESLVATVAEVAAALPAGTPVYAAAREAGAGAAEAALVEALQRAGVTAAGWWTSLDGVAAAPGVAPIPAVDPRAPAKLMFTSGTTGHPKGVVWSRECEATWARAYAEELIPLAAGEEVYTCLPLFHVTAQGTLLAALGRGAGITVDAGFEPFRFWGRVREREAVAFSYVGTLLATLAARRPAPDDAQNPVRYALGAAAPLRQWREIESRFGLTIVETWGQTETASCWTAPLPGQHGQPVGSVGHPAARAQWCRVGVDVDPAARPAGAGPVAAELWLRPYRPGALFDGYLAPGPHPPGRLSVDRSAFTPAGWYRTGDLFHANADGSLSYAGRLREAIRRRGELVPAAVVEEAALAEPGVLAAAAVGVPAPHGAEEEIKLCVVAEPGATLSPAELHAGLTIALPGFMVPRYIELLAELPLTPTTRVRKHLLAQSGVVDAWDAARHPPASPRRGGSRPPGATRL